MAGSHTPTGDCTCFGNADSCSLTAPLPYICMSMYPRDIPDDLPAMADRTLRLTGSAAGDEPGSEKTTRGLRPFRTDLTTPAGKPAIPPGDASLHHVDHDISTPTRVPASHTHRTLSHTFPQRLPLHHGYSPVCPDLSGVPAEEQVQRRPNSRSHRPRRTRHRYVRIH